MERLFSSTETEEVVEEKKGTKTKKGYGSRLIVYNDEHNTFDWVIQCFMEVLEHTYEQAEQLSIIIHFKGKACVKRGPRKELKPQKDALVERGLSAVLEDDSEDD